MKTTVDRIIKKLSFFDEIMDEELKLNEDLGFDSLKIVGLIIAIEDELQIQFNESDLDPSTITTLHDLYTLVEKYVKEQR